MKEYAVIHVHAPREAKARSIENIPSARKALEDHYQRLSDYLNIDKMPGGNTPENVKILGQRLRRLEMELIGAIPAGGGPEYR